MADNHEHNNNGDVESKKKRKITPETLNEHLIQVFTELAASAADISVQLKAAAQYLNSGELAPPKANSGTKRHKNKEVSAEKAKKMHPGTHFDDWSLDELKAFEDAFQTTESKKASDYRAQFPNHELKQIEQLLSLFSKANTGGVGEEEEEEEEVVVAPPPKSQKIESSSTSKTPTKAVDAKTPTAKSTPANKKK